MPPVAPVAESAKSRPTVCAAAGSPAHARANACHKSPTKQPRSKRTSASSPMFSSLHFFLRGGKQQPSETAAANAAGAASPVTEMPVKKDGEDFGTEIEHCLSATASPQVKQRLDYGRDTPSPPPVVSSMPGPAPSRLSQSTSSPSFITQSPRPQRNHKRKAEDLGHESVSVSAAPKRSRMKSLSFKRLGSSGGRTSADISARGSDAAAAGGGTATTAAVTCGTTTAMDEEGTADESRIVAQQQHQQQQQPRPVGFFGSLLSPVFTFLSSRRGGGGGGGVGLSTSSNFLFRRRPAQLDVIEDPGIKMALEDTYMLDFIRNIPPPPLSWQRPRALPPMRRDHADRITLVLDLDETLVHCCVEDIPDYSMKFDVTVDGDTTAIFARLRPDLQQFLERVSQQFEVILFTASQRLYADKLLDLIDPEHAHIQHRLFREHCMPVDGVYVKDLDVLGRSLSKTIIIDNSPQAFAYQLSNGVPIASWYEDPGDNELLRLLPFLEDLALKNVEDVRPHLRQRFKLHHHFGVHPDRQ